MPNTFLPLASRGRDRLEQLQGQAHGIVKTALVSEFGSAVLGRPPLLLCGYRCWRHGFDAMLAVVGWLGCFCTCRIYASSIKMLLTVVWPTKQPSRGQ